MEESMDMNQLLEQDTAMRPVHNGQLLTGEVVENTGDQAILNVGRMYDGVLTQDQLPEGETLDQFPVGTQNNGLASYPKFQSGKYPELPDWESLIHSVCRQCLVCG